MSCHKYCHVDFEGHVLLKRQRIIWTIPSAPCKTHGFPRLITTFFWQLRRRGREQGGLTLAHFTEWQSGLVVIFVFFLSDSYAILCRLKSELLEKHADAHASSMLATENNNNLSESSHESQRSKKSLASLWNEYREQWRNTEKLKLARMDLKRLQTPQTQVIDTTRKASRCYYFLPLFWTILYDRYVPIYIITQVILAFWLVPAYDLLEDRRTIGVIITKFFPLPF